MIFPLFLTPLLFLFSNWQGTFFPLWILPQFSCQGNSYMQFCSISLPGVSVHDNQWTSSSDSWCWCCSQRAQRTGTYQLTPNDLFISLLLIRLPAEPQFTKAPTYNKALGHLFKLLWNQHSYSAKVWPYPVTKSYPVPPDKAQLSKECENTASHNNATSMKSMCFLTVSIVFKLSLYFSVFFTSIGF